MHVAADAHALMQSRAVQRGEFRDRVVVGLALRGAHLGSAESVTTMIPDAD